jgi:hypothetical protein
LTRLPMEKPSNGTPFIQWHIHWRLLFAGMVHRSHGMTLERAVIDCRAKFWEHWHISVAFPE